jgi:soluble lytic murein transglycosylase-like protein
MWVRLLALSLVAALAGAAVGLFAAAGSSKEIVLPPGGGKVTAPDGRFRCPIPSGFRPAFVAAARDADLPLAMLVAVAKVESRLEPKARSAAGAQGLLQVMPSTGMELSLDVDEPASNVLAGARYLRHMLERFRSTDLALAAYNAGPTAVDRSSGAPTTSTLTYVANVTEIWRSLVGCS